MFSFTFTFAAKMILICQFQIFSSEWVLLFGDTRIPQSQDPRMPGFQDSRILRSQDPRFLRSQDLGWVLIFLHDQGCPEATEQQTYISVFVDLTIGGEADVNKDQRGGGGRASRHNITSCIKCLDDNTVLLDNAIMLKPDYFIFTRNNRHQRVNVGAESHKYV